MANLSLVKGGVKNNATGVITPATSAPSAVGNPSASAALKNFSIQNSPVNSTSAVGDAQASSKLRAFSIANSPSASKVSAPSTGSSKSSAATTLTSTDPSTGSTSSYDASVNSFKDQALKIQDEVNKLKKKEDTAGKTITASDTGIANDESTTATRILTATHAQQPSADGIKTINDEIKRIESERQAELDSINSSFDVAKTGQENAQNAETGKASVQIANAGGYLGFSGSGQGVVLNLAKSHRDELMALQARRQEAVQSANSALNNKRYDLAKLKAQEIDNLDNEMARRNQEYFSNQMSLRQENRLSGENKVASLQEQNLIHNAIQTGATGADGIFGALNGKVPIEKINSFLTAATPKAATGGFKFNPTQTGLLMGTGLAQTDIQALNDTINEVGYTDEVRAQLPANVRAVTDKIYLGKTSKIGASKVNAPLSSDPATASTEMRSAFETVNQSLPVYTQKKNETRFAAAEASHNIFAQQDIIDSIAGANLKGPIAVSFKKMGIILRVNNKLTGLEDAFAKTNPGIYTSAIQGGKAYFGIAKDPAWLNYVTHAQSIINDYRNNVFGASLTTSELKAANKSLPNFDTDPFNDVKLKMNALSDYAMKTRDSFLADAQGKYYIANGKDTNQKPIEMDTVTGKNTLDEIVQGNNTSNTTVTPSSQDVQQPQSWMDHFLNIF